MTNVPIVVTLIGCVAIIVLDSVGATGKYIQIYIDSSLLFSFRKIPHLRPNPLKRTPIYLEISKMTMRVSTCKEHIKKLLMYQITLVQ